MMAARRGYVEIVQVLLQAGATLNNKDQNVSHYVSASVFVSDKKNCFLVCSFS